MNLHCNFTEKVFGYFFLFFGKRNSGSEIMKTALHFTFCCFVFVVAFFYPWEEGWLKRFPMQETTINCFRTREDFHLDVLGPIYNTSQLYLQFCYCMTVNESCE